MITSIDIRDFVLIERLELALGEGLNVLTGGSGEGKTLVVQAVRFLFGGEGGGKVAAARLVRPGADEVVVEATLAVQARLRAALAEVGVPLPSDVALVRLRRALDTAGRGRAQVDAGPSSWPLTVSALRAIGQAAVEVFGQGDAVDLALEARQRAALDSAAGLAPAVALYGERRERALALARQVDDLEAEEERLRAEATRWREERDALADLDPKADELPQLVAQAEGHAAGEAAAAALDEVLALLVDGDEAAFDRVRTALGRLERAAPSVSGGDVQPPLAALGEGLERLSEAAGAVRRLREAAEGDAEEAARVRERIGEWRALARRLRIAPEALAARWTSLREVEAEGDLAARRAQAEQALARLERELERDAAALAAARAAAAPRLAAGMRATLPGLGLTGAFEVRLGPAQAQASGAPAAGPAEQRLLASHPAPHGRDRVAFWLAPGAGQPLAPLDRASGGELSRVFLALGLETARARSGADGEAGPASAGPVLVFDEVDQNVGARLGAAIGACLAGIGAGRQVLAVTHLAPVAARARLHVRLVKTDGRSRAEPLGEDARVEELALMIRGAPVTAVARAQARELLEEAAAEGVAVARPARAEAPAKGGRGRRPGRAKGRGRKERVALA